MRNPEILTHANAQTMYVPINFEGHQEKTMRAGSPISMKGKLANDNTAMGILLDDVTREYPMGEIVIFGFVDFEIAQNASGVVLTPEAKSAMKNITFVGDPESGVSGGGGEVVQADWGQEDPTAPDYVKNRPLYDNPIKWESEHIQVLKGEKKSITVQNVPIILGERIWYYTDKDIYGSITVKATTIGSTRRIGSYDGCITYCLIEETEESGKYNVTVTHDNQSKYYDATDAYIMYDHEGFKPLDVKFLPQGGFGYESDEIIDQKYRMKASNSTEGYYPPTDAALAKRMRQESSKGNLFADMYSATGEYVGRYTVKEATDTSNNSTLLDYWLVEGLDGQYSQLRIFFDMLNGTPTGDFWYENAPEGTLYIDLVIPTPTVVVHKIDKKFLPEEGVTAIVKENFPGGVGYETTATVNEPLNITWNGNTEGLVSVPMIFGGAYYKVSESVFTNEQIKQMYYHVTYNPDGISKLIDSWDSAVEEGRVTDNIVAPDNDSFIVFVRNAGATLFEGHPWACTFPERGVYFKKETEDAGGNYILDLRTDEPIEYMKKVAYKIEKKFISLPITYFYANGRDSYMYIDSDYTTRVTNNDYIKALSEGEIRIKSYGSSVYVPTSYTSFESAMEDPYAALAYMVNRELTFLFTAEYEDTPPPM